MDVMDLPRSVVAAWLVSVAWPLAGCGAGDDAALQAEASTYRDFTPINARPFPTAQHQDHPLVNVWANDLAAAPYRQLSAEPGSVAVFPVGAMIVKEMLDADGGAPLLTVIARSPPGFDPDHGDWWYGRLTVDGDATGAGLVGRVGFCIGCHAAATDHLFGVAADNLRP